MSTPCIITADYGLACRAALKKLLSCTSLKVLETQVLDDALRGNGDIRSVYKIRAHVGFSRFAGWVTVASCRMMR